MARMGAEGSFPNEVTEEWGSYTLIDVRSQEEWNEGHINGAILIPHTEIRHKISEVVPDKTRSIKVYCRSGGRASTALNTLKEMGYQNVDNLGGFHHAKQIIKDAPEE